MAWYYNNIRIYVQDLDGSSKQIIPRLQPLEDKTVLQIFGWDSNIYKVQCKIVGYANTVAVVSTVNDGVAYQLVGPDFDETMYLASASWKPDQTAFQTLDPQQDCETPVYTVNLEFYWDG